MVFPALETPFVLTLVEVEVPPLPVVVPIEPVLFVAAEELPGFNKGFGLLTISPSEV